jgi:hypothetical protein
MRMTAYYGDDRPPDSKTGVKGASVASPLIELRHWPRFRGNV